MTAGHLHDMHTLVIWCPRPRGLRKGDLPRFRQLAVEVNSRRKEAKTMKYEKPEVVRVASALEAVQDVINKNATTSTDTYEHCSTNAYAADE